MTDHLRVVLDVDKEATKGVWDHSDFPHPLVTCDYDAEGNLYSMEILGPLAADFAALVRTIVAMGFRTESVE